MNAYDFAILQGSAMTLGVSLYGASIYLTASFCLVGFFKFSEGRLLADLVPRKH